MSEPGLWKMPQQWKSKNGISAVAWKSRKGAGFSTFPTGPTANLFNKKCVTYVSEHVLPISSVHTLSEEGNIAYTAHTPYSLGKSHKKHKRHNNERRSDNVFST
jgi:hypothetical protein